MKKQTLKLSGKSMGEVPRDKGKKAGETGQEQGKERLKRPSLLR